MTLVQPFTMHTPNKLKVEKQHYFQLFEYHWTTLETPKKIPILTLWNPPAFRMSVLLLCISALEVATESDIRRRVPIPVDGIANLPQASV
jgi:hypothetical protein